jgi:hypothetical protein
MKKMYTLALLAVGMLSFNANAQTEEEKAWMAYMTPGQQHQLLAEETGNWDCEMKFWMVPDAPPQTYKSVADIKMVMGGRYQEGRYSGSMMGTPFEGLSTVAYDNAAKKFISTWVDNMGTGMMVMYGNLSKDGKTITFMGEMTDPMTGKPCKVREVYTIVDKNTRKLEMFDTKDGKEVKSMEIVMKRRA